MLVWLLRNRVILGRLSIILTFLPFYLASIPILTIPMALSVAVLLFTLNWQRIKSMFFNFLSAHFWLKLQYFWFFTGIIVTLMFITENVEELVAAYYIVGLAYLFLYFIWFNKINTMMTREDHRIILKGETMEQESSYDFVPYLVPISYTLIIVFTIASLESIFLTSGARLFAMETFYWYFVIFVLFIHFIVDMVFVEQIEWNPKDGMTQWKPIDFNRDVPDVDQPSDLDNYFERTSKLPKPPDGLAKYIEGNLEYLVKEAQSLDYFPFQLNYVRSVGNWGREGRDHVQIVFAIVLASVSQYRFIGLIPLYKRKMFYQTLQIVAMTGSMTTRWRELIQFEVIGKKDEHFVLDWVLGSRYLEMKYKPDWQVTWEGDIYKGKIGYYEAVHKMDRLIQIRPDMTRWELDIWNLCFEYAHVFVGEEGRQLLSKNIQFYDKLLYLSGKRTTEEYETAKEEYQQRLLNPSHRLVVVPSAKTEAYLNETEKRDVINSYLTSESQEYHEISIKETIFNMFSTSLNTIRSLNLMVITKVAIFFIVYLVNLFGIYLLDRTIGGDVGLFLIAIEIVILFIFSISPSDRDINLSDKQQTQAAMIQTYSQTSTPINSANLNSGTIYLLYGISLLFVYRYLFL